MALRKLLFMAAEGYSSEFETADDLDLRTGFIQNLANPVNAQDAATKFYVDSVATGLDWKNSVRLATAAALPANTQAGTGVGATLTADANGALSVDGVAVAVGNRILVKNEATGEDNGIYVVTATGDGSNPYILTRATDADQDAEVTAGLATFVTEGTTNADSGWVLVTNDAIVVDTTALSFSQFSSTVAYTFDQGLLNTGGAITVELDTAADAQGAGAGGGSSGLEFDVNSAAGKLRAAVHATGGINRSATGLLIELDPTANTAGSNPTNATSAAGLTNLRSPKVEQNYIAAEAIAAGDPVAWSTTNDKLFKGLASTDAKSRIIGVARTAAAADTETLAIVTSGVAAGVLTGATVNTPYYLAAAGGLTTTAPSGGNRIIECGIAKNATDLFVRVVDYGKKAA